MTQEYSRFTLERLECGRESFLATYILRIAAIAALVLWFPEPKHLVLKVLVCIGIVATVELYWREHFPRSMQYNLVPISSAGIETGMSHLKGIAFESSEVTLAKLRERLRNMSEQTLCIRFRPTVRAVGLLRCKQPRGWQS